MGRSCAEIAEQAGCKTDAHPLLPDLIPMGTPVSVVCPETCEICASGASFNAVAYLTEQESLGVQKLGLHLNMVPDGMSYTDAAAEALGPASPSDATSRCLWFDDYTLTLLRAKRSAEAGDASLSKLSGMQDGVDFFTDLGTPQVRETIPGIGVYHGPNDIAEYTMLGDPRFNGGFAHVMKRSNIGLDFSHSDQVTVIEELAM
eukprot:SAG31_NODE_19205_length_609_cov_1.011765_1_plen_202_part_11